MHRQSNNILIRNYGQKTSRNWKQIPSIVFTGSLLLVMRWWRHGLHQLTTTNRLLSEPPTDYQWRQCSEIASGFLILFWNIYLFIYFFKTPCTPSLPSIPSALLCMKFDKSLKARRIAYSLNAKEIKHNIIL